MAIIATDWADHYGGRQENFLMQQMRNLANPQHLSTTVFESDPVTDRHYVTSDHVNGRQRFHLHRRAAQPPINIFD